MKYDGFSLNLEDSYYTNKEKKIMRTLKNSIKFSRPGSGILFIIISFLVFSALLNSYSVCSEMDDLHDAIIEGKINKVESLITENPDLVSSEDGEGNTPLHIAASSWRVKGIITLLLKNGADVNARNNYGNTPLHTCILYGVCDDIAEVILLLIENGADINALNFSRNTPLDLVEPDDFYGERKILINHGAKEGDGLCCEVFSLIRKGDIEKLKELIEENPDIIHFRDIDYGETPLHVAIYENCEDISLLLIEKGADINAISLLFGIPVLTTAISKNIDLAKLLIEKGVDINPKVQDEYIPLTKATVYGQIELAKILIRKGAKLDVNLTFGEGHCYINYENIMDAAVNCGDAEMVELLFERGFSSDYINSAVIEMDKEKIKLLLDHGEKSLHGAAFIGDIELAKAFLDEGFDINEKIQIHFYDEGDTTYIPIDFAVEGRNPEMVEFLISQGANLHSRISHYHNSTLLERAKDYGYDEIVEILSPYYTPPGSGSDYIKPDMVLINGGVFDMGNSSEKPIHTVEISDFYIGKYEVTNREYRKYNPDHCSDWSNDNYPVESVPWFDVIEYCNWLSDCEGLERCYTVSDNNVILDISKNGYRLPTEAEWEYACRGGTTTDYYWGEDSSEMDDYCWYSNNSSAKVHPVGQKTPNPFGLYDMCGNIYEYCWDWFDFNYYEKSPYSNPTGPETVECLRVTRGGSWNSYNSTNCSSFARSYAGEDNTFNYLGFRLVRGKF